MVVALTSIKIGPPNSLQLIQAQTPEILRGRCIRRRSDS